MHDMIAELRFLADLSLLFLLAVKGSNPPWNFQFPVQYDGPLEPPDTLSTASARGTN